jgi:cystathionine beta-lyase/cystathionine gamma-synthase
MQMKGPPGILSVEFVTAEVAQQVMKKLKLFTQATSLGGCMSLVDWRYAYVALMFFIFYLLFFFSFPFCFSFFFFLVLTVFCRRDKTQPEALLRVSVGLEDPADLITDWKQALAV